jgi:queuine tRNA-ribosyltransferase
LSTAQPAVFGYRLSARDGAARQGEITTARGVIRTPAFMPVGTAATVKALYPEQVKAAGADILLANTYHLMLRPGPERIGRLGGLHGFMRWRGLRSAPTWTVPLTCSHPRERSRSSA